VKLYLIQHGEAKSEAEDPKRSLTLKGEEEVKRVTDFLRNQMRPEYDSTILTHVAKDEELEEEEMEKDEKYDKAVDLVIQTGQASISMIQRKLRVGYNRAARMIEIMEKEGIVGPSDGVRARDVYGRRE